MSAERFRVWTGFVIIATVWGSTWLAIKIGLDSVPPFFGAAVRFAIASMVLFLIVRIRNVSVPLNPEAKKLYAVLAVLSYMLPFALVYWAEQFIPSALGSILFAAFPFWVAIFSQMVLQSERLNAFKVAGILLGFFGIVIIFSGNINLPHANAILGMVAMILCTIMQALSTVLVKKYGQPISPFAMNLVGMSLGSIGLFVLSFLSEQFDSIVWDEAAIGSILYLSLAGSVLTFVTYFWLLKRIEAVYLSLSSFINPIVAVILGSIILNETLPPKVFTGASLVLAGILVANGKQLYAKFSSA